ncbi:hypothetical protein AVEN_46207-1, partial [Araneus ventricosus]
CSPETSPEAGAFALRSSATPWAPPTPSRVHLPQPASPRALAPPRRPVSGGQPHVYDDAQGGVDHPQGHQQSEEQTDGRMRMTEAH